MSRDFMLLIHQYLAIEGEAAGIGKFEAGNHPQQGGFA